MGWVNKDSNVKMYQQGGSIEKKYKAGGDVKEETTPKSTYGKSARMDTKSGQFEAKPSTYGLKEHIKKSDKRKKSGKSLLSKVKKKYAKGNMVGPELDASGKKKEAEAKTWRDKTLGEVETELKRGIGKGIAMERKIRREVGKKAIEVAGSATASVVAPKLYQAKKASDAMKNILKSKRLKKAAKKAGKSAKVAIKKSMI